MVYNLRAYIDPEEVFARVKSSLKSYADMDMILMDDYYKVIDHCNAVLGRRRIAPKKEKLIKVKDYRAELPSDFLMLNLALVVGTQKTKVKVGYPSKTLTLEGRIPTPMELSMAANLDKCCNFKLSCGKVPTMTCQIEEHFVEFEETYIARLTEKRYCSSECFNLYSDSPMSMEIIQTGSKKQILIDHLEEGLIYVQYDGRMNDENYIPICFDHPIILNFYEKAIKHEILQDLYINKRLEVAQALQLSQQDKMIAQGDAINLVSTPEAYEYIDINNALKRRFRKQNHFIYNGSISKRIRRVF